jgi:hypothetical protein
VVCRLHSSLANAPPRDARMPQPPSRSRDHDIHHTTARLPTCHHTHSTPFLFHSQGLWLSSVQGKCAPPSPRHHHPRIASPVSIMLPRVSRLAVLLPTATTPTTVCRRLCVVASSRRRARLDSPSLLPPSRLGLGGDSGRSISTTLPTAAPAPKRGGGGGGPKGKSSNNLAKER